MMHRYTYLNSINDAQLAIVTHGINDESLCATVRPPEPVSLFSPTPSIIPTVVNFPRTKYGHAFVIYQKQIHKTC